jgi:two-component system chemotaxis response regulator CheB
LIAGSVFVVPPGHHGIVTPQGRLCVFASDGPPLYRPSADLLLTSMAVVAPRRSIAVILSGTGHDGATGGTALRHLGGIVVASDEATSNRYHMPQAAIARGAVDAVLPLDQIARYVESTLAAGRTARHLTNRRSGRVRTRIWG